MSPHDELDRADRVVARWVADEAETILHALERVATGAADAEPPTDHVTDAIGERLERMRHALEHGRCDVPRSAPDVDVLRAALDDLTASLTLTRDLADRRSRGVPSDPRHATDHPDSQDPA